jgi:hypothetical protein
LNSLIVLHQQGFEQVKEEDMEAMMGKDNRTGSMDVEADRSVYLFVGIQVCRRTSHC